MSSKLILALGGIAAAGIIGLAVVLIVVVSGGSDKKDDAASGDSRPTASSTKTSDSSGPAASGELRIRGGDPLNLDPALAQDADSAAYIVEIFSGLVRIDKNLQIQPDLAERWDVSPDGKTYTFHINKNAQFQDGRPVSADDVKYSWERALNPDTGSVTAENFLGDIVGARDLSRGRADSVSGIKAADDTTVAITIDAPKSYFLYKLSYPTAFVVDKRQIAARPNNWTQKPNGTGPYKLKEWKIGERVVLEAYDKHHLGAPKLKTVTIGLSGGSSLIDYEDGNIDITGVGLDDLARVQDPNDKLNKEYAVTPRQSIDYIGFNTQSAPFDDANVRKAFAMSVDRKKIADVILKSAIPVANGLLPPGVPGATPDDKTYPFDPEGAKRLLSESRYGTNLPEITLAESGAGATVGPTTEAIVADWKKNLGVDVKITQAESGTFFDDIDQGRYQMFHLGWIMDYSDPEDVLDVLFHTGSKQNSTRYSNPSVDQKLEQARTEAATERRLALYRDVEKTLVQEAPWVPMFFDTTHALVKPYVKNYSFPAVIIERYRDVEVNR